MKTGKWAARAAALGLSLSMALGVGLATEAESATDRAWDLIADTFVEMANEAREDPQRLAEVTPETTLVWESIDEQTWEGSQSPLEVCTMEVDGKTMRYTLEVVGEPDEDGLYPLYITLHGGGGAPPEINDVEWNTMSRYYRMSVENGIYVAVRGMEDVWNLHFVEDAFPMYDRLIENMVMLMDADPNRVYLLGFSAGGDGVYAVAPRMADRFAAVNMSSGHPNGISLLNTANLPFEIQTGIRDYYTEDAMRAVRNAEYEETLNGYQEKYGCPYIHRVLVHVPWGHNFVDYVGEGDGCVLKDPAEYARRAETEHIPEMFCQLQQQCTGSDNIIELSYAYGNEALDNAIMTAVTDTLGLELLKNENTNAVTWVSSFTRTAAPDSLVWDLSTRASSRKNKACYWLRAEYDVNAGVIQAVYDQETNTVYLKTDGKVNGAYSVLANPNLMDYDRPLKIVTETGEKTVELEADPETVARSLKETGDPYLAWTMEIPVE